MVPGSQKSEHEHRVEDFFARFDGLLLENASAALAFLDGAPSDLRELDVWVMCRSDALAAVYGPERAAAWLQETLLEYPGFADAHYQLAGLFERLGDTAQAIRHHLATLELDLCADEIACDLDAHTLDRIARTAAETLAALPEPFRSRVGRVSVFLENRPSEELVQSGFDSRALGLFSGPNHEDTGTVEPSFETAQITLFTHCLWEAYGLDETSLLEEVRVTVLHEVGHYFGLNEDEVAALGLA